MAQTKILVTDCTTCSKCKLPVLLPGQNVPKNWKHFCTGLGMFAVTTTKNGSSYVGLKFANSCKHYSKK